MSNFGILGLIIIMLVILYYFDNSDLLPPA